GTRCIERAADHQNIGRGVEASPDRKGPVAGGLYSVSDGPTVERANVERDGASMAIEDIGVQYRRVAAERHSVRGVIGKQRAVIAGGRLRRAPIAGVAERSTQVRPNQTGGGRAAGSDEPANEDDGKDYETADQC